MNEDFIGKKFLEIGYGATDFLKELQSCGAGVLHGVDKYHAERLPGMTLVKGDLDNLPKHFGKTKYHAIFGSGVFESESGEDKTARNFADKKYRRRLLQTLHGMLEEGGWFISQYYFEPTFTMEELEKQGFQVIAFNSPHSAVFGGVDEKEFLGVPAEKLFSPTDLAVQNSWLTVARKVKGK